MPIKIDIVALKYISSYFGNIKLYHHFFSQKSFKCRHWEEEIVLDFDPATQNVRQLSWVNRNGEQVKHSRDFTTAESAYQEASKATIPDIDRIQFPDPQNFVAGQIHENEAQWQKILDFNSAGDEIKHWVENWVDIKQYMKPFKGEFWGKAYDCDFPPPRHFNDSNKCRSFIPFINETIKDRLQSGAIECIGQVGKTSPPRIIVPLTVEPNNPRLCVNLMYVNNWIIDKPFTLDILKDVPRVIEENVFLTSIDDKSGFDNVKLAPDSYDFEVFQWAGYFFRCLTLPFGFKLSSYIYHSLHRISGKNL